MIRILKTSDEHQTISFCVLTPDVEDRNGDIISADEIIKTAHDFGANMSFKYLNVNHEEGTQFDVTQYIFVENFIAPNDIKIGDNTIAKGSWYVGIKFLDEQLYKDVKDGEYIGVSMEGYFLKD